MVVVLISSSSAFTVLNSFQLSAISSVAILNDTQRSALQYVITRSAQDSKRVASKLLVRVQRLGYSENDLKKYVFESGTILLIIFMLRDSPLHNIFFGCHSPL